MNNSTLSIFALPLLIITTLCFLTLLLSGLGTRLDLWSFRTGFMILRWSAYIGGASAVLALIGLLINTPQRKLYLIAFILGAISIGIPYAYVKTFRQFPTLADASTDLQNPPVFVEITALRADTAKNPLDYRGEDAPALQQEYFPDLKTISINNSPSEVITAAEIVANEMGLEIIAAAPEQGRLEAVETSLWFGFKDDLVIRAQTMEQGVTIIDARSASRVGKLDGGVNAKRIEMFLAKLEVELKK